MHKSEQLDTWNMPKCVSRKLNSNYYLRHALKFTLIFIYAISDYNRMMHPSVKMKWPSATEEVLKLEDPSESARRPVKTDSWALQSSWVHRSAVGSQNVQFQQVQAMLMLPVWGPLFRDALPWGKDMNVQAIWHKGLVFFSIGNCAS